MNGSSVVVLMVALYLYKWGNTGYLRIGYIKHSDMFHFSRGK